MNFTVSGSEAAAFPLSEMFTVDSVLVSCTVPHFNMIIFIYIHKKLTETTNYRRFDNVDTPIFFPIIFLAYLALLLLLKDQTLHYSVMSGNVAITLK